MANYNKVLLIGNLTRDPDLRYTAGGTAVVNFGMAVNRNFTGQDGARREETTFVDCEAWAKQAETLNEYLKKGSPIFVEGRLKFEQWETQDGQKRSKLRVVCERFQFLGRGGGQESGGGGGYEKPSRPAQPQPPEPEPADFQEDDDIPF